MKLAINYKRNLHQKEFDEDIQTKFLHLSSGFAGGKSKNAEKLHEFLGEVLAEWPKRQRKKTYMRESYETK